MPSLHVLRKKDIKTLSGQPHAKHQLPNKMLPCETTGLLRKASGSSKQVNTWWHQLLEGDLEKHMPEAGCPPVQAHPCQALPSGDCQGCQHKIHLLSGAGPSTLVSSKVLHR